MCACSTRHRSLRSLILQRGSLRPPFDPRTRAFAAGPDQTRFAFWTSDRRCFTLRPPDRCFGCGPDQESLRALHGSPDRGRLRSPLDPHRPAFAAVDLHEGCAPIDRSGALAPCPTNRWRAAPVPLPNRADWMRPPEATAMKKTGRSGSQKRRTTARIAVNCTPRQKALIVAKARDAGSPPPPFAWP